MNELIEQPEKLKEISVMFTFTSGCTFTQGIPMKYADAVEDLLAWYRNKKSKPTWTWDYTPVQEIRIFQKIHIIAIDIEGYIELAIHNQKWYEKLYRKAVDKIRTKWMLRKL